MITIDAEKSPTAAARAFVRAVDMVRGCPEAISALVEEGIAAAPAIARSGGPAYGFMSALIGAAASTTQTEPLVPRLIDAGLAIQHVVEANNSMAGYGLAATLFGAAHASGHREMSAEIKEHLSRARNIKPNMTPTHIPDEPARRGPTSEAAQAHRTVENILQAPNLQEGPLPKTRTQAPANA